MVSCPQCNANVTGQFCSQCGTRVQSKCGSCNAMVKAGSRFCSHCGKPVGGASAPASKTARPAQAVPSKSTSSRVAPAKPASSAPARRGFASARGAPRGGGAARKWGSPKAKLDVSVDTAKRVDALDVDASSVGRSNIAIKKTHRSPAARAAPSSASRPAPSPSSSTSTAAKASTPTPTPSAASSATPTVVTERPKATVSASTPVISASTASSSLAVPSKKKKRHSKILISDGGDDRTAALDVVGLEQNKPKKKGIGNMWAQRMQEQQNEAFQKNRDKLRSRRRGGVEFMDQQIRNLITEMKRLNENCGSGMASVKYGTLFRETIDSMPALSATLTCAKKRSVVTYEGGMLMQGTSDNIVISLIKDEIEDSADFKSVFGAAPIKFDNEKRGPEKCEFCNKTVYPTERVHANGKTMHKQCFRCCECQTVLKLAAFAFNGGKFYCETHFQQLFKKGSGYNF